MPITIDKRMGKKDGLSRYRVRVSYTDMSGKQQRIERLIWGKAEAQAVERELETKYKNNRVSLTPKITINQLISEYDVYHATETKKTSHETAMKTLRLRVVPYVGEERLDKLTTAKLMEWKNTISRQKLSLTTKKNAYVAFMGLLNYALTKEYIPKNPLKALKTFKDANSPEEDEIKIDFYTVDEFQCFIKVAESHCDTVDDWNYYVFFSILFYMGLRKGECYGLTWRDIEGNIMHIRRSISQKVKDEDGNDLVTIPKTKSGRRDILIPKPLVDILTAHRKRQQEAAPMHFNEDFRVCGYGKRAIRDTTVEARNKAYAEEAGLKHIRIHDFRHSHASFLINKGANILAVSKRMGHASITETLNTYSHLYNTTEESVLEFLNEIKI